MLLLRMTLLVSWFYVCCGSDEILQREKRYILFPRNAFMGIFLAVATPVHLPNYDFALSFNLQANYFLPANFTQLTMAPQIIIPRSKPHLEWTRHRVYQMIEETLTRENLAGRQCLLRAICDTASTSKTDHNGLLGDLIYILLTPSTSNDAELADDFREAEEVGRDGRRNCNEAFRECTTDIFDYISKWM